MDVLSDVLRTLRLNSRLEFRGEFAAPWGFCAPARPEHAVLYIVSRGNCFLEVEGRAEPLALAEGEMVLLPRGDFHLLRDSPDTEAAPIDVFLATRLKKHQGCPRPSEGDASGTLLIAGCFEFESRLAAPFLTALGPLVYLRTEEESRHWLEMSLRLLCMETRSAQPGSEIMAGRLLDLLFIQLIRARMAEHQGEGKNCNGNFLRAFFDPLLGEAVKLIHLHPERAWTVAELASAVGMSRTAFAVRFSRLAGVPPLTYATQWRMLKAEDLLSRGEATLAEVAANVGYDSEAAFSTAFKREVGVAPGRYRRKKREQHTASRS